MKKIQTIIMIMLLSVADVLLAQTQHGYIKTLGRPEKPGEALSGVSVRVKGQHNTMLSGNDGTLAILLPGLQNGDAYTIQQVQKKGYVLNETSLIGRQQAFSDKVRLVIVMVPSEQLDVDKQRIEDKAFEVAKRNYDAEIEQLKRQLNDNAITEKAYLEAMTELQKKFENYQLLIDGLAEHYSHTDYDVLDEREREINLCIENGELERADMLIKEMFDPLEALQRNKDALAELDKQIAEAHGIMAQANDDMAAVLKQQEKDAEHLYQLYTISLAKFDNEKADFYIVTRAELDTTRYEWQFDAGIHCYHQGEYAKAEKYFKREIDLLDELLVDFKESGDAVLDMENKVEWLFNVNIATNNLAAIYSSTMRFKECEELLLETMDFFDGFVKINPEAACDEIPAIGYLAANSKMALASVYKSMQRYKESEKLLVDALKIYRRVVKAEPATYEVELAKCLSEYGMLYKNMAAKENSSSKKNKLLEKGEKCYIEAVELLRRLVKEKPQDYEAELARVLYGMGQLYRSYNENIDKCEACFKESMEIYRRLVKENPRVYTVKYAWSMEGLEHYYYDKGRYAECESLDDELYKIYQQLTKDNYHEFAPKLVLMKVKVGNLYHRTERYVESVTMFMEALDLYNQLEPDERATIDYDMVYVEEHIQNMADYLDSEARELRGEKKYKDSEVYYLKTIEIYRWLAKEQNKSYDEDIAGTLNGLGILYVNTNRYDECKTAFTESLELYKKLAKTNPEEYQSEVDRMQKNLEVLDDRMKKQKKE